MEIQQWTKYIPTGKSGSNKKINWSAGNYDTDDISCVWVVCTVVVTRRGAPSRTSEPLVGGSWPILNSQQFLGTRARNPRTSSSSLFGWQVFQTLPKMLSGDHWFLACPCLNQLPTFPSPQTKDLSQVQLGILGWWMDTDVFHSVVKACLPVFCGQVGRKAVSCGLLLWVTDEWPRLAFPEPLSGSAEQPGPARSSERENEPPSVSIASEVCLNMFWKGWGE